MSQLRFAIALVVALALSLAGFAQTQKPPAPTPKPPVPTGPVVVMETEKGTFEIEMFPSDAPKSVAQILALVRNNFYRGQRFHWVQPGVVQIGDPTSRDMSRVDTWGSAGSGRPVGVAETSKRKFDRGVVGLAYRATQKPSAADSQIFILRIANPALEGKYAAIGRVLSGMNIVDKLEKADMLRRAYVKGDTPK
jgi:peptidylprolyl isomerase